MAPKELQDLTQKWQQDIPAAVETWQLCFNKNIAPVYDYPECIRNLVSNQTVHRSSNALLRTIVKYSSSSSLPELMTLFLLCAEKGLKNNQWLKTLPEWTKIYKAPTSLPQTAALMRSYRSTARQ